MKITPIHTKAKNIFLNATKVRKDKLLKSITDFYFGAELNSSNIILIWHVLLRIPLLFLVTSFSIYTNLQN